MAITDLTNTKWIINQSIDILPGGVPIVSGNRPYTDLYKLFFTSAAQDFREIVFRTNYNNPTGHITYYTYPDWAPVEVYTFQWSPYQCIWYNEEHRTIHITGGDDATNPLLIEWFENNATLIIEYHITYNLNDGVNNTDNPSTFTVDNLPVALEEPTKAGYRFLGWYENADFSGAPITEITTIGDKDLYARWELITYTITYNSNGGSSIPKTSNVTQLPNPLPTPTKENHTFLGWYYDSDFTNKAIANDEITENVTLYAKWQSNIYLTDLTGTKWKLNDDVQVWLDLGVTVGTFNINFTSNGNNYTSFTVSHHPGNNYNFIRYDLTIIYRRDMPANNGTWTNNNYKVIEITGGTDVTNPTLISWLEKNATQIIPKPFEVGDTLPAGKIKISWDFTGKPIGEDDAFLIISDGGLYIEIYEHEIFIQRGSNYEIVSADTPGYITITLTEPCTITTLDGHHDYEEYVGDAFLWEIVSSGYSITFKENGGTPVADLTEQTALPNPLPIPTNTGYTFIGWYYDSDFTNEAFANDPLTDDVTLYARWSLITYSIMYYLDGGVNNASNPDEYAPVNLPLTLAAPTKEGYRFLGWYAEFDFSGVPITEIAVNTHGVVILYARWELITYTITYNSNGGTPVTGLTEQTALPNPLPTPTKEKYTFLGWYYDSDFTNEAFANDPLTDDVTLYARWELTTYTITYNSNGGNTVPQTSNVTQLPSELPVPTKARSAFVGWYYDSTLKQKAKPNDMINTNITLYAKWYDSLSAFCTDIANLIREFENSGDNIKATEFVDRLRALLESV